MNVDLVLSSHCTFSLILKVMNHVINTVVSIVNFLSSNCHISSYFQTIGLKLQTLANFVTFSFSINIIQILHH